MEDCARFLPDDHEDLVCASFACPVCLRRPSVVRLAAAFDEPGATCACLPCGTGWEVAMSSSQLLRLTLSPPRDLFLEPGGSLLP